MAQYSKLITFAHRLKAIVGGELLD